MNRRRLLAIGSLFPIASLLRAAPAEPYKRINRAMAKAAEREGEVLVYSTTYEGDASAVLDGFREAFPHIRLIYCHLNSNLLFDHILADRPADIAWSSAFDLQFKLVNDHYAQVYRSTETDSLPLWANWRHEAYGTTAEPIAIVYNKQLLPSKLVPSTHADLTRILTEHREFLKGKVVTYDPERSGTGYLLLSQDIEVTHLTWSLIRALGSVEVKLAILSDAMLDSVSAGQVLIAYNVIGSYALQRAANDPMVGVVLPSDYTLLVSRFALIPRAAQHPNAARLFLDYLLSREGQARLASRSLNPIRDDVAIPSSAAVPDALKPALRPIHAGPGMLAYLDRSKQSQFLAEWRQTLSAR